MVSSPNLHMVRHVREYFQNRKLPPEGTVCEANERRFIGLTKPAEKDEEALLKQLRLNSRILPV